MNTIPRCFVIMTVMCSFQFHPITSSESENSVQLDATPQAQHTPKTASDRNRKKFFKQLQTRNARSGGSFSDLNHKRERIKNRGSLTSPCSDEKAAPANHSRRTFAPAFLAELHHTVSDNHVGNQAIPYAGKDWKSHREQPKSTQQEPTE